jgi:heterotetrameric sarcosine oxidase gamma subunit
MSIEIDDRFRLFEVEGWSEAEFEAFLASLGLPLPNAGEVLAAVGCRVMRITPRLAWVLADADTGLPWPATDDGVAVDLSNSRLRLHLTGRSAEVLPRLVPVDFDRLGPTAFVASMMHGIPVTILRAEGGFDLLVPRSFGESLVEWIDDATAGAPTV